jgi:demethylmenaquinone methyltransferase/2-methoxy-6-polyprenyl-1,4-benzoquinol methylase
MRDSGQSEKPEIEAERESGPAADRFAPHAAREMAHMFDDVSGRYDLLNRVMTLGRDGAWRAAMAAAVPEHARVVLDLCTGNGVSLTGLRRPGRLLLGADVSLGMLELAHDEHGRSGWAPRFIAADAFHLPLRDASVDAITIAFGVRNLRPRPDALAEMARVMTDDGTLAVLEATAPRAGWFAPFHAFHLRHVIPLAGRLSPDPSAYEYLSRSIFEFGSGVEFEREIEAAGFERVADRAFMLGATRLWVGRRREKIGRASASRAPRSMGFADASQGAPDGRNRGPGEPARTLQNAREGRAGRSEMPQPDGLREAEWRWWMGAQLAISAALLAALIDAGWMLATRGSVLPLPPWQRRGLLVLVLGGSAWLVVRTVRLVLRVLGPPPR